MLQHCEIYYFVSYSKLINMRIDLNKIIQYPISTKNKQEIDREREPRCTHDKSKSVEELTMHQSIWWVAEQQ